MLHWTSDWNSGLRLAADYTAFAVALLMLYFQAVEVYTEVQATVDEVVSSRALSALVERARPPLYYIPRAEASARTRVDVVGMVPRWRLWRDWTPSAGRRLSWSS